MLSMLGEYSGNTRSTPSPNDILRTVKLEPSPAVRTRDAHPFERLDAGALAFDDAHADAYGVARTEFGDGLATLEFLDGLGLELLNQVHLPWSFVSRRAPEADWSRAPV